MDLIIKIKEIKGKCPVFKTGDQFKIVDGFKLISDIPICMHALVSLMPYYNALRYASPAALGLSCKDDKEKAYIQCLDPERYTGGGTVIFEITKSV